jgi:hypothetical protein
MVLPLGLAQFSGTFSLPHWAWWLPGQGFQEMPRVGGKAPLAASPAADPVVVAVTPVLTSSTAHPNTSAPRV